MEEKEIWEIADYEIDATLPEDKVVMVILIFHCLVLIENLL